MRTRVAMACLAGVAMQVQAGQGVGPFPAPSNNRINLAGNDKVNPKQGVAAYFRTANGQPDSGHTVISQNGNSINAYYYFSGAEHAPWPPTSTDTAWGESLTGMQASTAYFNDQGGNATLLSFRAGQEVGNPQKTWNLGGDVLGQDWFASAQSRVEERIYKAAANDIGMQLCYGGNPILEIGYSAVYMIIDYGPTGAGDDDNIRTFSDPVTVTKVAGLQPYEDGLADAILADVGNNGGGMQLRFDTGQTASRSDWMDATYTYGIFSFSGSLQVVNAPGGQQPGGDTVPALDGWGILALVALLGIGAAVSSSRLKRNAQAA